MSQQQRMKQADRTDLSDSRMLEAAVELIVERGTRQHHAKGGR